MKCVHTKENGSKCNAYCMHWSNYCYLHNPEISDEEKKTHQSRWGKQQNSLSSQKGPLDSIDIQNLNDVAALLVDTVNKVRTQELDIKTANCIWFLCNHLMKAYELSQLEKKLDAIKNSLHK